jgi:hypothetical protein
MVYGTLDLEKNCSKYGMHEREKYSSFRLTK